MLLVTGMVTVAAVILYFVTAARDIFVGQVHADGQVDVKLTTARLLAPEGTPLEQMHALLGCLITASGYLSDGQRPFHRQMSCEVFLSRMQAVLRRRFGDRAPELAQRQWALFFSPRFD